MLVQKFLNAFISFFVIANPLGVSTVFVALMAHSAKEEITATARKATLVALGVLLFFSFLGEALLTGLGIRLPSFHVAGGILLFAIAFQMLFSENRFAKVAGADQNAFADRLDIAVFPLAIPLIAGPGCMTVSILLMSRAENWMEAIAITAALLLVMALTYVCMLGSRFISRVLGVSGTMIIARVMGVILAARSVQFIVDGVRDIHALFFAS